MKPEQKIFLIYFVFPIAVFNFGYLLYAKLAASLYYNCPSPEFTSLIMCAISKLFEMLKIGFFTIPLPNELAKDITAETGFTRVYIDTYYSIFNVLKQRFLYNFYPYYLLATLIFGFILMIVKRQNLSSTIKENDKLLRGIHRILPKEYCKISRKKTNDVLVSLPTTSGDLFLSEDRMKEHLLILGSTGSGKSQLLLNIVNDLIKKDIKLIFVDRKGEFYAHFGDNLKDILLNPFDYRSLKWDLFNEIKIELDSENNLIRIPPDVEIICDTLFNVNGKNGDMKYWYESASAVLQSAICWCIKNSKTSTKDLIEFLHLSIEDIIKKLETLPSYLNPSSTILAGGVENKTALSVFSTLNSGIKQLGVFIGNDDENYSVREWIHKKSLGNLYLSTAGKNDDTFTSIVSLLIDLIGREIKEFPDADGTNLKLCFVIDELSALPPLKTLIFLLTQARSKGVSVIIANQTYSKIKNVYGHDEAANIVANCKSKFIFSLTEAADAKYLSEQIGSAEVERKSYGKSQNKSSFGRENESYSENKSITQDVAVLPSEIATLNRGEAFVMLPHLMPLVSKIQFNKANFKRHEKEFVPLPIKERSAKEIGRLLKKPQKEVIEKNNVIKNNHNNDDDEIEVF